MQVSLESLLTTHAPLKMKHLISSVMLSIIGLGHEAMVSSVCLSLFFLFLFYWLHAASCEQRELFSAFVNIYFI